MNKPTNTQSLLPSGVEALRRHKRRILLDKFCRYGIGFGGVGVIIAITLIFFYLFWVVLPLLSSAKIEQFSHFPVPGSGKTVFYSVEEQTDLALRITDTGQLIFFDTKSGEIRETLEIPTPEGASISVIERGDPTLGEFVVGFDNGSFYAGKIAYKISYPGNVRTAKPSLEHLSGEEPLPLIDDVEDAVRLIAIQSGEEGFTVAATLSDGQLMVAGFEKEESLFDSEVSYSKTSGLIENVEGDFSRLLLNKTQDVLSVLSDDKILYRFDIRDKEEPGVVEQVDVSDGARVTDMRYLAGSVSLLIANDNGNISQWFAVRNENNVKGLTRIRDFEMESRSSVKLAPEYFRKSFVAFSEDGNASLIHTTAQRVLLTERLSDKEFVNASFAPRANFLIAETSNGEVMSWRVHNEHPEVSWHSLWEKVWYEGYSEPEFVWQSSAASNDFEPKFSLVPISFGTLKAAFYAMLLAMPLSILGAIYAAYFMAPKLRQSVKPTIEIMEALPTVILGFLAGLWLAPFLEEHLPAVFALVVLIPLGIILFSLLWSTLPGQIRNSVPDGWMPILLIPLILLLSWLAILVSPGMESVLFDGSMPSWMKSELGIDFDQRNSLVVGLAMGFAVIPTIFSIAEDAIFSVPKHLTNGSLALGATPWQTLVRVVLPTASPGIFSGVMIGFGRAVGETMIVLMATGNTPVMDMSIFQGMRTLSANIAVEMPESEVASSHYRILFLAALVLFVFTFLFNTLAELVRQRLREKYSSI